MTQGKHTASVTVPAVAAALALAASAAHAGRTVNIDVGLGAEYHSNAARVHTNEQSDTARIARAGFSWVDPTGPLSGDVNYQASRRDFIDNIQRDETAVNGMADLKWDLAPRRFDVVVQHQISRTLTTQQAADIANNRESRSVLTGGVDGFLHLSPVDSVVISPRYTDIRFSRSTQANSKRATADLTWRHLLDPVSELDVTGGAGHIRFDDSTQNYDNRHAEVAYKAALARLSYTLGSGYTWINRDHFSDVGGYSLHLAANYQGENFNTGGTAVRQLTDTSMGLAGNNFSLTGFSAQDSNFNQVDVVTRTQLDLYWNQRLNQSSSLNFGAGGSTDRYKVLLRNQDIYYAQAGYQLTLNAYWNVSLLGRYSETRFKDDPQHLKYKDKQLTATAQYRFNPRLNVDFAVTHFNRGANVSTSEYTDNVVSVGVNFKLY